TFLFYTLGIDGPQADLLIGKVPGQALQVLAVMLPRELSKQAPKTHLTSEEGWRLGVQQNLEWVHNMTHEPEPHTLLFRGPLPKKQNKTQSHKGASQPGPPAESRRDPNRDPRRLVRKAHDNILSQPPTFIYLQLKIRFSNSVINGFRNCIIIINFIVVVIFLFNSILFMLLSHCPRAMEPSESVVPAAKPDNLSLILRNHTVEREPNAATCNSSPPLLLQMHYLSLSNCGNRTATPALSTQ
ncbi:hypothetical protein A6R68_16780, partial [Neotoma lepida]